MTRYQAGDSAAAARLIECVSPQLHRFFVVAVASRSDADDLLQETWLRIHKARRSYRPGAAFLPWLYAIARRVRIDHFRRVVRITSQIDSLEDIANVADVPQRERRESESLESLLAELPESQREVIELLKVAGMSLEEVARATSSTVGAVKQKAHRAYKKLKDVLSGRESMKGEVEACHERRRR